MSAGRTWAARMNPTEASPAAVVSPGLSARGPRRNTAPVLPAARMLSTERLTHMRAVRIGGSQKTTTPSASISVPAPNTVRHGIGREQPPAAHATPAMAINPAKDPRFNQPIGSGAGYLSCCFDHMMPVASPPSTASAWPVM
jgi:hypothetical protein